ncbi:MAG: disulfide bond formation protein B [Acidimicrobiales bacterium]
MPVETVSLFLALLFVGAMAINLAALALVVVRLVTGRVPGPVAPLVDEVRSIAPFMAFLAPTIAMFGSLYYSEIAHFEPCQLCWVQRFLMYPSSILLGISMLLKQPKLAWLPFALSVVGLGVSSYHRAEQQWPNLFTSSCDPANPCSGRWVDTWGFVTIPTMAFAAFGLVCVFVPLSLLGRKEATS